MIPSQYPHIIFPSAPRMRKRLSYRRAIILTKTQAPLASEAIMDLKRRGFESKSAKRAVFQVFQGILERWVDQYGPQDREAAIAYAKSRLHRDLYIKKENFKEGLDAFFKIYLEIPVQYRNTSLELLSF